MKLPAFSLIEVCLAMAILTAVGSFGLAMDSGVLQASGFRNEVIFIGSLLRRARSQAMNNIDGVPHGIHFENGQYVIFEGPSWDLRNYKQDISFPASSGIKIFGTSDFIFSQISGNPKTPGNIELQDGSDKLLTISVNSEGQINENK